MKKLNLLIGLLIGFMILSCSSDDSNNNDDPPQSTIGVMEVLLVQGSPWTFDHYEMISIIDGGNSTLTQQEIEAQTNQDLSGNQISFFQNGTGFTSVNGAIESNWEWEIINQNQLKITYSGNDFEIMDNLTVSSNELRVEYVGVTYDLDTDYEVLHNGTYFYN